MMSNQAYYVTGGEFGLSAITAQMYIPANEETEEEAGRHIPECQQKSDCVKPEYNGGRRQFSS